MNRIFPQTTPATTAQASTGTVEVVTFELPAQPRAVEPVFPGQGDEGNQANTQDSPMATADGQARLTAPSNGRIASAIPLPTAPLREALDLTGFTEGEIREAREREALLQQFAELKSAGLSGNAAAAQLGRPASWFSQLGQKYAQDGFLALLPRRRECGRKPEIEVPDWFITAARFFYLATNRTHNSGSVPEALRCAISLPECPPMLVERLKRKLIVDRLPECPDELRSLILGRERAGKPMLPERLMRAITVREATIRQHRNPTNAALDLLNAPGTMMWLLNERGEREFIRSGDVFEADDATINFPVCVPWTIGGCPCSDRYGVKVGRFQWLVSIDVGSRYVTGYSYTMRPRSSYRGEDVLALMRSIARRWGVPAHWRLEQGVWKSNLVVDAVKNMGAKLITVHSPHNKPFIEGLFNTLWTKLSVQMPDAQVGRYQGENEKANDLLTACQRGHRDPRRHIPLLADALGTFDRVIAEKHRTPVRSELYGSWVPEERWTEQLLARPMRGLDPETDWIFSPFVREWRVQGMCVGGRVPLFESLSVPFDFTADFLPQYHGARVRCYFDPSEPRCFATLVLADDFGNQRAGQVLGRARQINDVASYARTVMGWGEDDRTAGLKARQQASAALRRENRTILPNGRIGTATSEERDGIAAVARIERGLPANVAPVEAAAPAFIAPARETAPVDEAAEQAAWEARQREFAEREAQQQRSESIFV